MPKSKEVPFEELMSQLEAVVSKLESGKLTLEDSFSTYESGVGLVRQTQAKLKTMEGKIEQLMKDGSVNKLHVDGIQDEPA